MSGKRALIVVDMQKDYLGNGRKNMFSYDTPKLTAEVNRCIREFRENGDDIIYIRQVFQNIITNRLFIGFTIKGTEGADIYEGVEVVSDNIFEKYFPDSFSSAEFREFAEAQDYSEIAVCGLDECGCVGATAAGAVKRGYDVTLISYATGTRFSGKKLEKQRIKLKKLGVRYK